jgi:hypothetical protein
MKVFIGSSKEAQKELREVEAWIRDVGLIAIPWDKPTLFRPGENTFLRLIELSKEVDAAVFIFSEDDKIWYRNDSALQPRDNILIEYGLFSGILGPTKTVLCRKNTPKLATDILGINYVDISFDKRDRAQIQLQAWAHNLLGASKSIQSNLVHIWENRHELRPSLGARIRNSKEDIFFVGFSLKSTFDHYRNVLTEILHGNRRPRIRMLMVHPNSLHAEAHETFSDREVRKEIRGVLHQMESFYNDLDLDAKNNIDIRLTHYLPRFAAKVFDYKTILLNLYMYKSRAQENPVIEITKSKHEVVFNNVIKSLTNLFNLKMDHKHANHELILNGKWNQLL